MPIDENTDKIITIKSNISAHSAHNVGIGIIYHTVKPSRWINAFNLVSSAPRPLFMVPRQRKNGRVLTAGRVPEASAAPTRTQMDMYLFQLARPSNPLLTLTLRKWRRSRLKEYAGALH